MSDLELRSLERIVATHPDDGLAKIALWEAQRRVGRSALAPSA